MRGRDESPHCDHTFYFRDTVYTFLPFSQKKKSTSKSAAHPALTLHKAMAGRRPELFRAFHADFQLKPYFLDGVTYTGNTLGAGAYGSVMEVCDS